MKRHGHLFEALCDYAHLYRSFLKAFCGSGKTAEASRFCFHLETELLLLRKEITEETYRPAPYRYFTIYDPKERIISVARFRDRVAHHAVVGVLEPLFDSSFIHDSYATRKGKGSHRAVRRAQDFLIRYPFYLKIDVDKYFDNIDHRILLRLIGKKVKDSRFLCLLERVIMNSDISRGLMEGKGLPIGNLTSQFFANVYLNSLDHYIKDALGEKGYVRYMDDMVFFSDSRDHLKRVLKDVEGYLADHLRLRLKDRATIVNSRLHGLPFLGYRVFPDLIRVKRENLQRVKKKLSKRQTEFENGSISEEELSMSVRSWFEYIGFADSLSFRQSFMAPMAALKF
jgi:retron-type reverse transcriptase